MSIKVLNINSISIAGETLLTSKPIQWSANETIKSAIDKISDMWNEKSPEEQDEVCKLLAGENKKDI